MGEKMIFLIVGDFGVGKDTIVDMLVQMIGEDEAYKIRSWTTREPRFPGEDTHNFYWWPGSTRAGRINSFMQDVLPYIDQVAFTSIDGEYYWTESNQFQNTKYEFYIINDHGAWRAVRYFEQNDIEYTIIRVVRPEYLLNIDDGRKNRRSFSYTEPVPQDIIFENTFTDFESLRSEVASLAGFIISGKLFNI